MGGNKGSSPELDKTAPENPKKDLVAMDENEMREHLIHEQSIKLEKAKKLLEKVKRCYHREDSNHHEECRLLTKQFLDANRGVKTLYDLKLEPFESE